MKPSIKNVSSETPFGDDASATATAALLVLDTRVTNAEMNQFDVLLGQGKHVRQHPGNIWLRSLLRSRYDVYEEASSSQEKMRDIAVEIVEEIENKNGRFLCKADDAKKGRVSGEYGRFLLLADPEEKGKIIDDDEWVVVVQRYAIRKVLLALRGNLKRGNYEPLKTPRYTFQQAIQLFKTRKYSLAQQTPCAVKQQIFALWEARRRQEHIEHVAGSNSNYNPQDVLLGQEAICRLHPGNIRFRHRIYLRANEYRGTNCELKRKEIALQVARECENENVRFLSKVGHVWVVAEKSIISRKITVALLQRANYFYMKSTKKPRRFAPWAVEETVLRNTPMTPLPPSVFTTFESRYAKESKEDDSSSESDHRQKDIQNVFRTNNNYNPQDVLLGLGHCRNHPGNVRFRHLIILRTNEYTAASGISERRAVAAQIAQEIKNDNGRFLRMVNHEWVVESTTIIKRKIRSALDKRANAKTSGGRGCWTVKESILRKYPETQLPPDAISADTCFSNDSNNNNMTSSVAKTPESDEVAQLQVRRTKKGVRHSKIRKELSSESEQDDSSLDSDQRQQDSDTVSESNNSYNPQDAPSGQGCHVRHHPGRAPRLTLEDSIQLFQLRKAAAEQQPTASLKHRTTVSRADSTPESDQDIHHKSSPEEKYIRHFKIRKAPVVQQQQPVALKLHRRVTRANTKNNNNIEVNSSESKKSDVAGASMHCHYGIPHILLDTNESDQQTKTRNDSVARAHDVSTLDTGARSANKVRGVTSLESDQDEILNVSHSIDATPSCLQLTAQDVLLGPGSRVRHHPGNVRFRNLILLRANEYKDTSCEEEKREIAIQIAQEIENENRRFIYLVDPAKVAKKLGLSANVLNIDQQHVWVVADKHRTLKKILQLLALVVRKSLPKSRRKPNLTVEESARNGTIRKDLAEQLPVTFLTVDSRVASVANNSRAKSPHIDQDNASFVPVHRHHNIQPILLTNKDSVRNGRVRKEPPSSLTLDTCVATNNNVSGTSSPWTDQDDASFASVHLQQDNDSVRKGKIGIDPAVQLSPISWTLDTLVTSIINVSGATSPDSNQCVALDTYLDHEQVIQREIFEIMAKEHLLQQELEIQQTIALTLRLELEEGLDLQQDLENQLNIERQRRLELEKKDISGVNEHQGLGMQPTASLLT